MDVLWDKIVLLDLHTRASCIFCVRLMQPLVLAVDGIYLFLLDLRD